MTVKTYIPWVVASALFMEQLDSTIVNTAIPAISQSLGVTPLNLKVIVSSYILSLAVSIPISGWMADRFGTRRVFAIAVALFTICSIICGLAVNLPMLVGARMVQGFSAALMTPVGRLVIIRSFDKNELLKMMNFVIIPALIGPLLGPTVGGLIVHYFSWREIFFINIPFGVIAQYLIYRHMPDYRAEKVPPLDFKGLILFGSGIGLLSWLLEVFNEHTISTELVIIASIISLFLITAYVWHAKHIEFPLLRFSLFKIRTFRIAVIGGFVARLGIGGMPFLMPLLYQIGLGLSPWKSGLLMMPLAIAAMFMKFVSTSLLSHFGYRKILIVNTMLIGATIFSFSCVTTSTPIIFVVMLSFCQGLFNSLHFSSMNSMAYSDIEAKDSSMATTIASSLQQMSSSFGLACASLVAAWYLGDLPQTNHQAFTFALHKAFLTLGSLTILSAFVFSRLHPQDGESVSLAKNIHAVHH